MSSDRWEFPAWTLGSQDGVVRIDPHGHIRAVCPRFELMFGFADAGVVARPIIDFVAPGSRSTFNEWLRTASESPVEIEALRREGSVFTIEVSGGSDPLLEGDRVLFFRDRGSMEEERRAREWLAAIVDSSDDAIISKSLDGVITSWNHAAERLFGFSAAEAIGRSIHLIIPPERAGEEHVILSRLREGHRIDHFETVRRHKSGEDRPISLTISPVRDDSGRIVGASKIARDVSERLRLQQAERTALEESERQSALKDEFLATLSHELRTPLSAILGWTAVLRRRPLEVDLVERGLDTIERNARMQTQLIEDLLDMSRINSGKVRLDIQPVVPMRIVEAALETVRPAADGKGVRLETFLDPDAGPISGDPGRLQQVLWNLLSNAIKFTPRGGKIQVSLESVNSHVEISVADTGEGIAPQFLPHVFERFRQSDASTTRRHSGLGLGLSIVRHLVELHGGIVRAKSRGVGQGATFVVQLPVALLTRAPPPEYQHPRTPTNGPVPYRADELTGIRILVVDDERDSREILAVTLEGCGAIVAAADSGADALTRLKGFVPDIVISDVGMPGMDGYEFLRRLRAQLSRPAIPAIALTAFARAEDRTRALRAGFLVHLAKPVEAGELVATIAAALGRWSE